MRRLLIIGMGSLGLEIFSLLDQCINICWDTVGFLDDSVNFDEKYKHLYLGKIKNYQPKSGDIFICGIADPVEKLKICEALQEKGAIFTNIIHQTAIISTESILKEGIVAFPHTFVSRNATVGNFVNLNAATTIGHDVIVGDGCTISGHCDVTGFVTVGRGVFMGTHVAIIPHKKIGDFAVLGAGSVILRNVPERVTVIGNPGKVFMQHDWKERENQDA